MSKPIFNLFAEMEVLIQKKSKSHSIFKMKVTNNSVENFQPENYTVQIYAKLQLVSEIFK